MSFIDFNNRENRISNLQETLRRVGYILNVPSLLVGVDGNFDEATKEAVADFQRIAGLPPTGTPDNETFSEMRRIIRDDSTRLTVPRSISPFPRGRIVEAGEESELVFLIQLMLKELHLLHDLSPVPLSGIFDRDTENAVKEMQSIVGMSPTGIVDTKLWNHLALRYNDIKQ